MPSDHQPHHELQINEDTVGTHLQTLLVTGSRTTLEPSGSLATLDGTYIYCGNRNQKPSFYNKKEKLCLYFVSGNENRWVVSNIDEAGPAIGDCIAGPEIMGPACAKSIERKLPDPVHATWKVFGALGWERQRSMQVKAGPKVGLSVLHNPVP